MRNSRNYERLFCLQNVRNYSPKDTGSHPTRHEAPLVYLLNDGHSKQGPQTKASLHSCRVTIPGYTPVLTHSKQLITFSHCSFHEIITFEIWSVRDAVNYCNHLAFALTKRGMEH
jgi:hypothetical protein